MNIAGVLNPNIAEWLSTDFIRIATAYPNSNKYINLNPEFITVSPTKPPGWASIIQIKPNNFYTRLKANYSIVFTSNASVPSYTE